MQKTTINIRGELLDLSTPCVMGIINLTPDSFYTSCPTGADSHVVSLAEKHLQEGALILDLGGYSTRPGAAEVSMEEEWRRLEHGITAIKAHFPEAILSVDTFRSEIARRAIGCGVDIINDISGGEMDEYMYRTVADAHVPYILMHMRGTPQTMQQHTDYADLIADVTAYFEKRLHRLHQLGVSDVIIDPGFGFAKTMAQNYQLLREMDKLAILESPILVGISHKSMIYRALDCTPDEALNGTSVLNTLALTKGANILRVHEVRPAVECIRLYQNYIS